MSVSLQNIDNPRNTVSYSGTGHLSTLLAQLIRTVGPEIDDPTAETFITQASALIGLPSLTVLDDVVPQFKCGGLVPWQFKRIALHVKANIARPFHISELAVLAKRSDAQFCRSFKVSTGLTPSDYVLRQRVAHAKHLMQHSNLQLVQIALDCGFADQAHFTRRFRATIGQSPGLWRRLNWDDTETAKN